MKGIISRLTMKKDKALSDKHLNYGSYYRDCYGVFWYAESRFGKREQVWHIGDAGISSK